MHQIPALAVDLDGRPGSVRHARHQAGLFLTDLAVEPATALRPETCRDVVLVVGELVANACLHAPGPCRLTLAVTGRGRVEVAVEDTNPRPPVPQRRGGPTGYGLRVVAWLSREVRVETTEGGKVVRAEVVER
ncbi:ATP-binding protein [Kitasatospora camelliae]|uniref:ATP-binding protein n=1 Tax=Kitasatospora camelliae TaxID=3156397 RepID=A0AAU8JTP0_9ACTN